VISFARENLSDGLAQELMPLFQKHYSEIAQDGVERKPNTAPYFALQTLGMLRLFTARDASALVGYAVFIMAKNPQHGEALEAKQDLMFLDEGHRRGQNGSGFLKWCDKSLADDGAEVIYQHTSVRLDYGVLLRRMGYEPTDIVYSRRVRKCVLV
jgi:hypothetical protein